MSPRPRRARHSHDSESDDDDKHVVSWIPGDDLEVEALAFYLREFIDARAGIRPNASPRDDRRQGFLITAKYTLSYDQVQDIMSDSRYWRKEKRTREWIKEPYNYTESDTAEQRIKRGAASGVPKTTPTRRRRQAHGEGSAQAASVDRSTQGPSRHDSLPMTAGPPPYSPPPERPDRPSHPDPDSFKEHSLEQELAELSIRRPSKSQIPYAREKSSQLPSAREPVTTANRHAVRDRATDKDRDRDRDQDKERDKDVSRDTQWSGSTRYYDSRRPNPG